RRHTRSTRDWSSDVCSSDLWWWRTAADSGASGCAAIPRGSHPSAGSASTRIEPCRRLHDFGISCERARRPSRHCSSTRASRPERKSTRLNSSHEWISYAVFCLKKKKQKEIRIQQRVAHITHHQRDECAALLLKSNEQ